MAGVTVLGRDSGLDEMVIHISLVLTCTTVAAARPVPLGGWIALAAWVPAITLAVARPSHNAPNVPLPSNSSHVLSSGNDSRGCGGRGKRRRRD